MYKTIKFLSLIIILLGAFSIVSCKKNKNEISTLKVFVRDENDELITNARVIIIGDTKSEPATIDYVDTLFTDKQGVAEFDLADFFTSAGKAVNSGYFNILVRYQEEQVKGYTRVKRNIVSVETVSFEP
jgi:hypothetical protein